MRNLNTSKEGWIPAANLINLIGKSKSCQSLTSSGTLRNSPKYRNSPSYTCLNSSIWLFFQQKAVALGTSAHHLAAVRPTRASLISNPEILSTFFIIKLPSFLHHVAICTVLPASVIINFVNFPQKTEVTKVTIVLWILGSLPVAVNKMSPHSLQVLKSYINKIICMMCRLPVRMRCK